MGSGVSCKVKLAKDSDNRRYAIKILKSDDIFIELIKSEVQTLNKLHHAHIVNLVEVNKGTILNPKKASKTVEYIVLELVSGGELFDFVANSGRFTEPVARYFFNQFMEGLKYMHD